MSVHTFEPGSTLERLMNDRRFRIGGLIAGALVLAMSFGAVNAAQGPLRGGKAVSVLPDQALNIPLLRQWPYPRALPQVTISAAPAVRVNGSKAARKATRRSVVTARR